MTESIPTTWNDDRDGAFFAITATLSDRDFGDDTSATELTGDQIDKALDDLLAADSWETMALRSIARSETQHRDLVPVHVVSRRAAR